MQRCPRCLKRSPGSGNSQRGCAGASPHSPRPSRRRSIGWPDEGASARERAVSFSTDLIHRCGAQAPRVRGRSDENTPATPLWRWAMVLIVVAVIGALSASPDAAAAVPRHPRPADVPASCLVGYCIVSVNPIGDGAIECEGTGLVEVLDVEVTIRAKVPYSRPYVTARISDLAVPPTRAGSPTRSSQGKGPQDCTSFCACRSAHPVFTTVRQPARGRASHQRPHPTFAFTFTVGGPSPISVAQGDATCEDEQPSRFQLVESAVMGSLLESPALGSIVKALEIEFGEDAVTAERAAHELLELWDQVHSAIALSEVLRRLDDPPDDNFTTLATYSALPPDAPIDGLPPAQQAAAEALFTQAETAIGYERAFLTSYERAWGAENAHAQTAYDTQMNAAAGLAMHAAEALAKLPALADAAQHAILPHPAGVLLTDEEISTYQQGVLAGTSDPVLIAGLESWGLSAANARDAELGAAAVDASSAAGQDVTSIFSAPADAFSAAATQLEAFATFATHRGVPAPIVAGVSPVGRSWCGWHAGDHHRHRPGRGHSCAFRRCRSRLHLRDRQLHRHDAARYGNG